MFEINNKNKSTFNKMNKKYPAEISKMQMYTFPKIPFAYNIKYINIIFVIMK